MDTILRSSDVSAPGHQEPQGQPSMHPCVFSCLGVNSLSPERYGDDFKCVILHYILMIDILSISSEIALGWIPQDFTDDESTMVQIAAWVNTMRLKQYGRHFPDSIFKCIFFNENVSLSIKFSLTFVPKIWINNTPTLVQIMTWCWPGDKPLFEPMMASLTDACHSASMSLCPHLDLDGQLVVIHVRDLQVRIGLLTARHGGRF